MDDVVKTKLIESIDGIQKWINAAGSFAEEQAPLITQEILSWGQVKCMAGMCISGCLVIICLILLGFLIKHVEKDTDYTPIFIFWIILTASFICWFASCVYQYLFIIFAPRLYIIEQLKGIIN